jgi:tRNA uridine 5-carboxymethylaminomethyl modification enzyme
MFTSRAEYRLLLRQDNADLRLSEIGHNIGLLPERNYQKFLAKKKAIENEITRLETTRMGSDSSIQILRRPEVTYDDLPSVVGNGGIHENGWRDFGAEVIQQVQIAVKYEGYIDRQEIEVERLKSLESKEIPQSFNYDSVHSLRTEARQKLNKIRPATLGQASRISGVSPSDIGILMVWLKRGAPKDVLESEPDSCASD